MDKAREMGDVDGMVYGKDILTLAVLSIIITAPIGAAIIAITGPILLHHTDREESVDIPDEENMEDKNSEKGYAILAFFRYLQKLREKTLLTVF